METSDSTAPPLDPATALPEEWDLEHDMLLIVGEGAGPIARAFVNHGLKRVLTMYPPPLVAELAINGARTVQTRAELLQAMRAFDGPPPHLNACVVTPGCSLPSSILSEIEGFYNAAAESLGSIRVQPPALTRHWAINGALNLERLTELPLVSDVGKAFAGTPVIIVGAGPSLAKNIDLLAEAQGQALILAVGRTLQSLRGVGVTPDFAINIETRDVTPHYRDVGVEDVPGLILSPTSYPQLFDVTAQRTLVFPGPIREQGWMYPGALPIHRIESVFVSCSAVKVALYWGLDPIILVGQDLCFPGGAAYHAGGADGDAKVEWNSETKAWGAKGASDNLAKIAKDANHRLEQLNTVEVSTLDGGVAPALVQHAAIRRGLEISALDQLGRTRMYNCTEGGAVIGGMKHVPLREVLETLPARTVDTAAVLNAPRIDAAVTRRRPLLESHFKALRADIESGHTLANEVTRLVDATLEDAKHFPALSAALERGTDHPVASALTRMMNPLGIRAADEGLEQAGSDADALAALRDRYGVFEGELGKLLAGASIDDDRKE